MYILPMDHRPISARSFLSTSGLTLTELMIAVALIGIGILASALSFTSIQKSIQFSKGRTLATNIAQEKIQIIMQKSYYEVLPTTAPVFLSIGGATIPYDRGYFIPEYLREGGMDFTRYTYVQVVQENSGSFVALPPDTPDTGMRQITETVVWSTDAGKKFITVKSILNNPNTVMSIAILNGVVVDSATHAALANALVDAAENVGWQDTTDAAGKYSINLSPGTFNFMASAPGYTTRVITKTIYPAPSTNSQDFYLAAISTGTLKGTAWINNHLVISAVVASTGPANGIEYVELYNPTTGAILIGSNLTVNNPNIWPIVWDASNIGKPRHLYYTSAGNSIVPSYGYYLISNTGNADPATACAPFTAAGVTRTPDACWLHVISPNLAMECGASPCPTGGNPWPGSGDAGGVSLGNAGSVAGGSVVAMAGWPANRIDSVGWAQKAAGNPAPGNAVEGNPIVPIIPFGSPSGLGSGSEFVRKTDTGSISALYGKAYDANVNGTDFMELGSVIFFPNTTGSPSQIPVTGTPATGALVAVSDGNSVPTAAVLTGNPPYALFTVPGVASGTWMVTVDSGSVSLEIDTVTVGGMATTWIPNSGTTPAWPGPSYYSAILSTNGITGIISGTVKDGTGNPIIGNMTVTAGNVSVPIAANGSYYIRLSTGTYDVIANQGNGNSTYASVTISPVVIGLGDMTGNTNFNVSKGGKASGWITRDGTNPLPGITVTASDINGIVQDTEVSGMNGNFLLVNLDTGTYTIQPVLDLKEVSSPTDSMVTVTAGNTIFSSSFTVTGALGTVTGAVTAGGKPIQSGVLVVVSTGALALPLPTLSINTLTAGAIYAEASNENGIFSVDVRGSTTTTYSVAGFYMTLNGQTPMISSRTVSGVTVTAGQTTSGVNLTW